MKRYHALIVALVLVLVSGVMTGCSPETTERATEVEAELRRLQATVEELQAKVAQLEAAIPESFTETDVREALVNAEYWVYFGNTLGNLRFSQYRDDR